MLDYLTNECMSVAAYVEFWLMLAEVGEITITREVGALIIELSDGVRQIYGVQDGYICHAATIKGEN